jgi:hypothetical protein
MDDVSATIVAGGQAQLIIHRGKYKLANFSFTLINLLKSFIGSLGQYMRKASRHTGGVDSLNPPRWRGKLLITMVVVFVGCLCVLFVL